MKPVVFHSRATAEVEEAIDYMDGATDGLGDEFRDALEAAVRSIGRHPKACSPYPDGYRRCFLSRRFPYSVFYVEYDDRVWVAAVQHAHREPDTWKDRTPE